MAIRLCKIFLLGTASLFLLLVVFNNLADYGSNYRFVRHVLMMDTVFEPNRETWRSISAPWAHHLAYLVIIGWEILALVLCSMGARKLWRLRIAPAGDFNRGKDLAMIGLTVNLALWMVAFLCVGGEWFLMWQSSVWNGQEAAFRMFGVTGIIAVLVLLPDGDRGTKPD